MKLTQNETFTPKQQFAVGFSIRRNAEKAKRLLAEGGGEALIAYIAAEISHGTTYFEDIFSAVRAVVGDYRLEQRASDLLLLHVGSLWETYDCAEKGPSYRLI